MTQFSKCACNSVCLCLRLHLNSHVKWWSSKATATDVKHHARHYSFFMQIRVLKNMFACFYKFIDVLLKTDNLDDGRQPGRLVVTSRVIQVNVHSSARVVMLDYMGQFSASLECKLANWTPADSRDVDDYLRAHATGVGGGSYGGQVCDTQEIQGPNLYLQTSFQHFFQRS